MHNFREAFTLEQINKADDFEINFQKEDAIGECKRLEQHLLDMIEKQF